jgi:hypothetical protein
MVKKLEGEQSMAKKRKAARKATKRPAKKRGMRTAKLKGRKVAKRKAKRAAPRKKQGIISSAVQSVTETLGLRSKLEGRNTFED